MSEKPYGDNYKTVTFHISEHDHAKLFVKLRLNGVRQGEFFRHVLHNFVEGDERTESLADDINKLSQQRRAKRRKLKQEGIKKIEDFALSEDEVNNIFDILDAEFEDL